MTKYVKPTHLKTKYGRRNKKREGKNMNDSNDKMNANS